MDSPLVPYIAPRLIPLLILDPPPHAARLLVMPRLCLVLFHRSKQQPATTKASTQARNAHPTYKPPKISPPLSLTVGQWRCTGLAQHQTNR